MIATSKINDQELYIALLYINGTRYEELNFSSYKRVPFGKVGWVYHPQVFGICNDEPIVFPKPLTEDWGVVDALALYVGKEGHTNCVGVYPLEGIDAGINKTVVVHEDSIFIPINFMKNSAATAQSVTMH